MLHYIFYMISLVLLTILLLKINNYHLFDDALVFSVGTNYLLILSTFLFYLYFQNYLFALFSAGLLFLFNILLNIDFKRILGYFSILSVPYFLMNIITLIKIILDYL